MMKHDSTLTNHHPTTATVCGHCGVVELKILHHVRLRGNFRRLCTTCVLRLHPQCFCPSCFGVYDRSPPDHAVVCYKCYSSSHPTCVSSPVAGPSPSSRASSPCSTCLNPNGLVFDPKRVDGSSNSFRGIDNIAARLLVAAAKIASLSMCKAELAAATEAERRAKEASHTKKRAREALDHVVYLMENEKRSMKSNKVVTGNANSSFVTRIHNSKIVASNEVLEALNAVELKEKPPELAGESVVSEVQSNLVVVVNHNEDLGVTFVTENRNGLTDVLGKTAQGEKEKNGSVLLADQEQSLENNRAVQENIGLQP